jgi:arginine decarboxylase
MSSQPKKQQAPAEWTVADAIELYRVQSWGEPFFFINEQGHVGIRALDEHGTTMDMVKIVAELRRRGVQFPLLIRFQDILRAQVRRINEAFRTAIAEANYGNIYRGIYPIKVNQLHEVVDELLDAGRPYGMGLECGSKAELIACLPQIDGETLLVCNGVKDRTMLSLMIAGQKLGQNIVPVMEKYSEFTDIKGLSFSTGYMSQLGVRVRLATRGSGRWSESSGTNSKFGLNVAELMRMVNELEAGGLQQKLVLLHCHIGSQVSDIQVLKQATKEVTQIFCALVKRGIGLKYLDVGGGLGVNYDKGHMEEDAGINYSLEEYANAVVFTIKEVCDANEVATPIIVTESGRALTAHHSVLEGRHDPSAHRRGERGRARARVKCDFERATENAEAVRASRRVPRREGTSRGGSPALYTGLSADRAARARGEHLLAGLQWFAQSVEAQPRYVAAGDRRARGCAHGSVLV